MHTLPIESRDDSGTEQISHVTIFFSKNDDLKKVYNNLESVLFLDKKLGKELAKALLEPEEGSIRASIWNLRLFRAYRTMSQSFHESLEFINDYLRSESDEQSYLLKLNDAKCYSLFDLLDVLSLKSMISYRLVKSLI